MAKPMPKAGRPHKTPGSQPAPRAAGVTKGTVRQRAEVDVPANPLGRVNGANSAPKDGVGAPPPKRAGGGKPSLPKQGHAGS